MATPHVQCFSPSCRALVRQSLAGGVRGPVRGQLGHLVQGQGPTRPRGRTLSQRRARDARGGTSEYHRARTFILLSFDSEKVSQKHSYYAALPKFINNEDLWHLVQEFARYLCTKFSYHGAPHAPSPPDKLPPARPLPLAALALPILSWNLSVWWSGCSHNLIRSSRGAFSFSPSLIVIVVSFAKCLIHSRDRQRMRPIMK